MTKTEDAAARFADLFQILYLTFHRRDGTRRQLSGASSAVMNHLAVAGPLTVGEAAVHLDRAQSVVSEIIDGLERKGLMERERDPADRRRTLVWLTPAGRLAIERERQVLDVDRLAAAFAGLDPADLQSLLRNTAQLIRSARENPPDKEGAHRDNAEADAGSDNADDTPHRRP